MNMQPEAYQKGTRLTDFAVEMFDLLSDLDSDDSETFRKSKQEEIESLLKRSKTVIERIKKSHE